MDRATRAHERRHAQHGLYLDITLNNRLADTRRARDDMRIERGARGPRVRRRQLRTVARHRALERRIREDRALRFHEHGERRHRGRHRVPAPSLVATMAASRCPRRPRGGTAAPSGARPPRPPTAACTAGTRPPAPRDGARRATPSRHSSPAARGRDARARTRGARRAATRGRSHRTSPVGVRSGTSARFRAPLARPSSRALRGRPVRAPPPACPTSPRV